MSTSAATHVVRNGTHISAYQRSDGYPTWVLRNIAQVLASGATESTVSLDETVKRLGDIHYTGYSPELRASCEKIGDRGLHLTRYNDPEKCVEGSCWVYILDFDRRDVQVWCNSTYLGGEGQVDPMIYLAALYQECQDDERVEIQKSIDLIREHGFTINGGQAASE